MRASFRLFLLVCVVLAGLRSQTQDPVLAKAIAAHQAGDLNAAVAGYRDFLTRSPFSFEIRSNLGAALSQLGRFSEAAAEYEEALKTAPGNPSIQLNLAFAYYRTGDIPAAARELAALHPRLHGNLQVTLLLANCWLQMGDNAKVIELLSPLEKQNPGDFAIAYLLGTAYVREKNVAEGRRLINRISEKGDSAEARLLLATTKMNAADFPGALQDLTRAIELNPRLPSVHAYYGQALMATGNTKAASQAFRAELALNPNDFTANLNLAVLLKQDRDYDQAIPLLQRALRIRPGDIRVRYQIGAIYLAQGKLTDALAELEAVVKEAPTLTEAHAALATTYDRLKRTEDGDRERAIVKKLNAESQPKPH